MTTTVVNALTIDVEDYFHIHAFSDVIRPEEWDSFEPRVERNTHRILDILDSVEVQGSGVRGQGSASVIETTLDETRKPQINLVSSLEGQASRSPKATFFVLGWVAERFPGLVKEIHARGHEVACHGYGHRRIQTQTSEEFKEDVKSSKEILENLTGTEVIGYRAPTYSINKDTIWALKILFELGFRYDSSIFPIKHDFYGFPEAPRYPFLINFSDGDILSQFQNPNYLHQMKKNIDINEEKPKNLSPHAPCPMLHAPCSMPYAICPMPASGLVEFPISTLRLLRLNLPCSGGGYFRLFPYWYTRWTIKKIGNNGDSQAIFYIHPWELDPGIPKLKDAALLDKFRTYFKLEKTESRLKRLLQDFQFAPLAAILNKNSQPLSLLEVNDVSAHCASDPRIHN